jgi:hypothetical protein
MFQKIIKKNRKQYCTEISISKDFLKEVILVYKWIEKKPLIKFKPTYIKNELEFLSENKLYHRLLKKS